MRSQTRSWWCELVNGYKESENVSSFRQQKGYVNLHTQWQIYNDSFRVGHNLQMELNFSLWDPIETLHF